jgi:Putative peptidoglycan binding domain
VQWWDPTKLWGAVVVGVAVGVLSPLILAKLQPTSPTPDTTSDSGGSGQASSCHFSTRGGLLYAGHSSTTTRLVDISGGEKIDAYEVQCLLLHAGISPGAVDGSFGQRTEKAVEQAQKTRPGTTVDGEVGHETWMILRTMK